MAEFQSDSARQTSNTALLQKLASAVDGHAATATFACGGSVPLMNLSTGSFGPGAQGLAPSVTIRWDPRNTYTAQSKIAFPLPDHDNVSHQMFKRLLHHCDPATFGVGGRDILDETYRKAAKLDASDFSTNFHPHDCGILDSIQQILLPSTIRGGQGIAIGPQGVRAELYKLNVRTSRHGFDQGLSMSKKKTTDLFRTFWQISIPCGYPTWSHAIWLTRRMLALST